MNRIELEFRVQRLDEKHRFRQAIVPSNLFLGAFVACDLLTVPDCQLLRSNLAMPDFSFWGEATRVISEAGGDVRVYEAGGSKYSLVSRPLLARVLDEWERFVTDQRERTVALTYQPRVLSISTETGEVVGSFESEVAQYFEGDEEKGRYRDTGERPSWIPNSDKYETLVGTHYALALTEDGRWVVIDDRRRIGGALTRRQIPGPEARAWLDRNRYRYREGDYPLG